MPQNLFQVYFVSYHLKPSGKEREEIRLQWPVQASIGLQSVYIDLQAIEMGLPAPQIYAIFQELVIMWNQTPFSCCRGMLHAWRLMQSIFSLFGSISMKLYAYVMIESWATETKVQRITL